MDIVAKHIPADKDGIRIAELDEHSYRKNLWDHKPLTDFWRVGHGIVQRLYAYGIDTMGKIARYSIEHKELFYKFFGVNAELLIDHAWGWEPCTMEMVKAYRPECNSMSSGQVLHEGYIFQKAKVVVQEMVDVLSLDLVEKRCGTDQLVLYVGYDKDSLISRELNDYTGPISKDWYGRKVPKHTHGSATFSHFTSSSHIMTQAVLKFYEEIVERRLLIRRVNISLNHVIREEFINNRTPKPIELDLFADNDASIKKRKKRTST